MIELKREDFLWKCYERYYQHESVKPQPGSVCNFFWKAVGGMLRWFFWDCMFLLSASISVGLLSTSIWLMAEIEGFENALPLGFPLLVIIIVLGFYNVFFFIFRYIEFWTAKGQIANIVLPASGIAALVLVVSGLLSGMWKTILAKHGDWELIFLLYGFLSVIVGSLFFLGLFALVYSFSGETSTGKVLRAYLGSFKDKVCPLVKSPWDQQPSTEPGVEEPKVHVVQTFTIPETIPVVGYLVECKGCGQKTLVETALNGSNHNISVTATCLDCMLPLRPEFELAHPEVAKTIKGWVDAEN